MAQARPDTWRPNSAQTLLVRAALASDERGRAAWEEWIATVDLMRLDGGSQRVLPLLYRNVQRMGITHPKLAILDRLYRQTWAKNQLALRHLEELVTECERAGIQTLILKGMALALLYYKDMGTRPMSDYDLLVPADQTDAAMALMTELGWIAGKPLSQLTSDRRAPFHGMGFEHPDKQMGCDLHWHITHIHLSPRFDAPMWDAAVPLQVGKIQSRALCPEHQLIHLFFNGSVNEGATNMRWLPDVLVLLRAEPTLDWARLVAQCQMMEFVQPVASMLEYLRTEWEVPVPVETIKTLARTRVSYPMRQIFACLNRPKTDRSALQLFWMYYTQYSFSRAQANGFSLVDFIKFLGNRWSMDSIGRTLKYGYQRLRGVAAAQAKELV